MEQNLSNLQVQVEEVHEVMTMGIDRTTTIQLEKDRMVTNI
jgi:hypothetical protein